MEIVSSYNMFKVIILPEFDVESELAKLKEQTEMQRKRPYFRRKSRLDKYHHELISLHQSGASQAELTQWLRSKRIKVAPSTVSRWLSNNG